MCQTINAQAQPAYCLLRNIRYRDMVSNRYRDQTKPAHGEDELSHVVVSVAHTDIVVHIVNKGN